MALGNCFSACGRVNLEAMETERTLGAFNFRTAAANPRLASQSVTLKYLVGPSEKQARQQRLGLWRDQHPIAPWEWRRKL
jgi:hypothetical protein